MPGVLSFLFLSVHRMAPWVLGVNMILYFVELQFSNTRSSLDVDSLSGFIWIERVIALFFTVEYGLRIWQAEHKGRYLISSLGLIDLVSILPFWMGFYPGLTQEQLGLVRGARTLRLLKIFRYNTKLTDFAGAIYKNRSRIIPIILIAIVYLMISSTVVFEVERRVQPEAFQVCKLLTAKARPLSRATHALTSSHVDARRPASGPWCSTGVETLAGQPTTGSCGAALLSSSQLLQLC